MKGRRAFLLLTCATALGSTAASAGALSMSQLPPNLQRLLAAEIHLPATQVVVTETVSPHSGGPARSSVLRARSTPAQTSETITNGDRTPDVVQIGRFTYVSATGVASTVAAGPCSVTALHSPRKSTRSSPKIAQCDELRELMGTVRHAADDRDGRRRLHRHAVTTNREVSGG